MKKSLLAVVICGLPLLPLDVPAAEDTARGQSTVSAMNETISARYLMLPICRGDARRVVSAHTLVDARVRDHQGHDVGTVDALIMDTKTQEIVYAVLSHSDSDRLMTLPWSKVQINRTDGKVRLSGQAEDFHPELNPELTQRRSAPIAILMNEVETGEEVHDSTSQDFSGVGVGMTPYTHPRPQSESTQEDWNDPGDGLTPYTYLPFTYDDE